MEGNSRAGAVVLTPLLSAEGLSVIPFVLERRHREELQFSKEMWCSVDRNPEPWGAVNCVTPHLHRGCVGSVLLLGSCVLRAWPLGDVGAALCLSWSMGLGSGAAGSDWSRRAQQGVFDIGSVQVSKVIKPKPQGRALSLKALGLSLC